MDITLKITKEQVLGNVPVTVFHLRGWLDAQGEDALLAAARSAYDEGSRFVLLDLAEVDTLTSAVCAPCKKCINFIQQELNLPMWHV